MLIENNFYEYVSLMTNCVYLFKFKCIDFNKLITHYTICDGVLGDDNDYLTDYNDDKIFREVYLEEIIKYLTTTHSDRIIFRKERIKKLLEC